MIKKIIDNIFTYVKVKGFRTAIIDTYGGQRKIVTFLFGRRK